MWSRAAPTLLLLHLLPGGGAGMCPSQCSCLAGSVSCSAASLSHVPHFLAPDTRVLDLSGNTIAKLESGLEYYTELRRANLSSNSLHSLGRNQFSSLSELATLDLAHNRLSKIRKGAFAGLHNLLTLDLRHNNLERLGPEVFTGLVGLERMDLSHNQVNMIDPDAFLHLRRLEQLVLAKNSLSTIGPSWPAPLTSLLSLDLSQNLILRLSLTSLSLRELDLSDNMLSSLPAASLSLPSLTSLDLAYNKLVRPPAPSLPLPSLRSLSLSGNMIRRLQPSSLAHLPSLSSLHLSALSRLESLSPLSLRDLHNLTSLSLSSCRRLAPLPTDLFSTTPRLRSLDLSHLSWSSLPASLLPPSLASLTLSGLPLACDCSLLWLWEAERDHRLEVEGATCDGTPLARMEVDRLACDQGDYLLVLAGLGGTMAILIVLAMGGAVVKCYLSRRSVGPPHQAKLQCDYLQYRSVPPPPGSPPGGKPYYSASGGRAHQPGGLDTEGLYYTLQPVYSSSSGSASSDPACTASSSYPSPVQHGGHYSAAQGGTLQPFAGGPPGTPLLFGHHSIHSSPLHSSPLHSSPLHSSPLHLIPEPGEYPPPPGGTQKRRTLVKYRYPDVLPGDGANQNYYV